MPVTLLKNDKRPEEVPPNESKNRDGDTWSIRWNIPWSSDTFSYSCSEPRHDESIIMGFRSTYEHIVGLARYHAKQEYVDGGCRLVIVHYENLAVFTITKQPDGSYDEWWLDPSRKVDDSR